MQLHVSTICAEMISALGPLIPPIRRRNGALAGQLERAATSVALNISEGTYSDPGTGRSRYFTAAGSLSETRTAVRVSVGLGYLPAAKVTAFEALADRVQAMLWRLTH